MYHASKVLMPNNVWSYDGLKIVSLVPGGAHGFLLKSCTPSSNVHVDRCGSMRDALSILRES